MTANVQDVICAFGNPSLPSAITQEPFDYDASHYQRLCRFDAKPDPIDLYSYADDLKYQEIQTDLLLFLLPVCLSAWQVDLMASHESKYAGFVEQFSAVLAKHAGFQNLLTQPQRKAVSKFMRHVILDKIDLERELTFSGMHASPYSWISAIGTFGTAFLEISDLWEEWWSCPTIGRACGVLQYTSVLMYPDDKNPVFSPWTPDAGGGAPVPWETDGHIFDQSWLTENVEFMRVTLTPSYVKNSISEAASILRSESGSLIAEKMVADFGNAATFVELRIEELIQHLSLPLGEVRYWLTT